MRTLHYQFAASRRPARRAHVGVVASGDLEVLLQPGTDEPNSATHAQVRVRTSVDGFDEVWQATMQRFFARTPVLGRWELNDAGATPALVTLRLQQAADAAGTDVIWKG
jgi:malonate decarboxylase delta subunit